MTREKHRQFMSIMIFFAFLLLRGKAFDLMVCLSSHCLSEPIYNDARINAKSKTHKNWNRASASDEREQLDVGLLFFLFHFLLLYISVKIRVSNARSTLFTNTKPVYYYNVPILKSGVFFSSLPIRLRFNTIQQIAIILYTLKCMPREKLVKVPKKSFTKINWKEKFAWIFSFSFSIFSSFSFFLFFFLSYSFLFLSAFGCLHAKQ